MIDRRLTLSLILGLLVAAPAETVLARTYKWLDANGGIHYTQVPPVDKKARILEVTGRDDAGETRKAAAPRPEGDDRGEKADTGKTYRVMVPEQPDPEALRKAEAEREKQQREACEALRNNLQILRQNTRIRIRQGDNGEARVLTPEEREARIREYSENIDKMCK